MVIYGRPAVGKTSVAACAPAPVFLLSPGETGLQTLIDAGQLPASIHNKEVADWEEYLGYLDLLATSEHSRTTLVVDVINGMEKLANVHVCRKDYGGDMSGKGFMSYQVGYRTVAMGVWKEMLAALDRLRRQRNMMILLLAHTGVGNHKNPEGTDYNRWLPAFDGKPAWEATFAWADIVLFADYEIFVKAGENNAKGKATTSSRRYFRTSWEPAFDAKNRHGLPPEIEMGGSGAEAWANIQVALAAGQQNGKGGK